MAHVTVDGKDHHVKGSSGTAKTALGLSIGAIGLELVRGGVLNELFGGRCRDGRDYDDDRGRGRGRGHGGYYDDGETVYARDSRKIAALEDVIVAQNGKIAINDAIAPIWAAIGKLDKDVAVERQAVKDGFASVYQTIECCEKQIRSNYIKASKYIPSCKVKDDTCEDTDDTDEE